MTETPGLNARVVRGPYGRLTHLDYRGQENRQGPTLSTACGRTVPANWTTAHHTAATVVPGPGAVELVTCPNCLAWARYHHVAELAAAVDTPELRAVLLATDAANSAARYRELVELLTPAQPATDAPQPRTDAPVAGCDSHNDRGRRAVLRLETARRRADLTAASRALPPAGMP